jgi:hypothetical protein
MMEQGTLLFDQRFMPRYAGAIIADPKIAIVELVANSWDAYATKVEITWPSKTNGRTFSIRDNGKGMTPDQFRQRWVKMDYDRRQSQGLLSSPPPTISDLPPRHAYGRNGRGRHAAFSFGEQYQLRTCRDGMESTYRVFLSASKPFDWEEIERRDGAQWHGTEIISLSNFGISLSSDEAREIVGTRFLTDPNFKVSIDGVAVTFDDIPANLIQESSVEVPGLGNALVKMIEVQKADRTTRQHGIAWWVQNRLVGECGWKGSDYEKILDGRTNEAKRFTFIVLADFLANATKPDWSDFEARAPEWRQAQPIIQDHIRSQIADFNAARQEETKAELKRDHQRLVAQLSPIDRDKWTTFVDRVVESCASISASDISQVAGVLAKLELSTSKYGLMNRLNQLPPGDLDELHDILRDWSVRTAKIALDEVQTRLKLIEELDHKLRDRNSLEVQDLQPLFDKALWVFGPEFESIEFTSNRGMTEVIHKLLGKYTSGSLNRPDFVIIPEEGSIGFYSRDSHGPDHEVNGVQSLVIAEIKRPGIEIGTDQKAQAWKYVKELIANSLISDSTIVNCFVLGEFVEPAEARPRTELDGRVVINPMTYNVFIRRAEKRMLNLREKLRDAPFLQQIGIDATFLAESPAPEQPDLVGV